MIDILLFPFLLILQLMFTMIGLVMGFAGAFLMIVFDYIFMVMGMLWWLIVIAFLSLMKFCKWIHKGFDEDEEYK